MQDLSPFGGKGYFACNGILVSHFQLQHLVANEVLSCYLSKFILHSDYFEKKFVMIFFLFSTSEYNENSAWSESWILGICHDIFLIYIFPLANSSLCTLSSKAVFGRFNDCFFSTNIYFSQILLSQPYIHIF